MRITSLVENISNTDLKAKHGLSLYIETKQHKILFDMGPDHTLFDNAKKDPADYEVWETALMAAGENKCDWTDKSYLKPIIEEFKLYVERG